MSYSGLIDFICDLEKNGELHRIKVFVDPWIEITEITDRITKAGGKALLFENNGTSFPVLINAFGSDKRMAMALGKDELSQAGKEIDVFFELLTDMPSHFSDRILKLPKFFRIVNYLPVRKKSKGKSQQLVHLNPDLSLFPVLKCWPHDGGRFVTLPIVHTVHPVTGRTNAGMYRLQILGRDTTAIHWQRHKTGANHFEAWKEKGGKMPVTVTLGGDPVYTYCATAPLPENINEYILAGFLRKKKVRLVKCITNNLYIPADADIVIEGYVDTSEELVKEGPFGDHTGFYSLADLYPVLHVTCITHSKNAVYPATIVGIPPQEDAWLAKATEKIFLSPVRLALQPEILDFHMPEAGVAHNLVVVRINKNYPGQGMKVINSLFGAGQMMFTKYLVVVSGNIDIRNYKDLIIHIFDNTSFESDILFAKGPLDVLDHSSESFCFGGKAGIDATIKLPEELKDKKGALSENHVAGTKNADKLPDVPFIKSFNQYLVNGHSCLLILSVNPSEDHATIEKIAGLLRQDEYKSAFRIVIAVDHTVDPNDLFMVAWQVLGNSDPMRDHILLSPESILIDGTVKFYRAGGFPRRWPNVVCSDAETIEKTDRKWETLGFDTFITSPSLKTMKLVRRGADDIIE